MYLDKEERTKLLKEDNLNYLIEKVEVLSTISTTQSGNHHLQFHYPVKELIIVPQRDDMEYINNWNNYTNWTLENIPPYSAQYNKYENVYYNSNNLSYLFYNRLDSNTTDESRHFQMKYFNENIITSIGLTFDGTDIEERKPVDFYNLNQIYQYYPRKIKKGIYVYSFSLEPDSHHPTGSINFSKIKNAYIELNLENDIPRNTNNRKLYGYTIHIYSIHYNILNMNKDNSVELTYTAIRPE